jgi:hypothetical protein
MVCYRWSPIHVGFTLIRHTVRVVSIPELRGDGRGSHLDLGREQSDFGLSRDYDLDGTVQLIRRVFFDRGLFLTATFMTVRRRSSHQSSLDTQARRQSVAFAST